MVCISVHCTLGVWTDGNPSSIYDSELIKYYTRLWNFFYMNCKSVFSCVIVRSGWTLLDPTIIWWRHTSRMIPLSLANRCELRSIRPLPASSLLLKLLKLKKNRFKYVKFQISTKILLKLLALLYTSQPHLSHVRWSIVIKIVFLCSSILFHIMNFVWWCKNVRNNIHKTE